MLLKYKDYCGSVTFDSGRLTVKILHIEDTITEEFDSAAEAQAVFEELVDDYLATCLSVGKSPSQPFKGSFNVRVEPATHRQASIAASEAGLSLNAWIAVAIEERLAGRRTSSIQHVLQIVQASAASAPEQSFRRALSARPATLETKGIISLIDDEAGTSDQANVVSLWTHRKVEGHA